MSARLFRICGALIPGLALVLLAACGAARQSESPSRDERSVLEVENRDFTDMTVYAILGSSRIRLGTATGISTTTMTIPQSLIGGGGRDLQFVADPIGGRRASVSERIFVRPGQTVKLTILR